MKIEKFRSDDQIEEILKIAEATSQKYVSDIQLLDRDAFNVYMENFWPDSNIKTDLRFLTTDEGKIIGIGGLLKNPKLDYWVIYLDMYPEFENEERWECLLTECMKLAENQNAPKMRFTAPRERMTLNTVLKNRGITPNYYMYRLFNDNLANIPAIEMPEGISIQKSTAVLNPTQFVKVMNNAYKHNESWVPDTEKSIEELETIRKKEYRTLHYYAYEGEKLVGVCNVLDKAKGTRTRFIDSIGVHSKFQNRGIGTALMGTVLRDLHSSGRKDVVFTTAGKSKADINLPMKFGFQEEKEKTTIVYDFKP